MPHFHPGMSKGPWYRANVLFGLKIWGENVNTWSQDSLLSLELIQVGPQGINAIPGTWEWQFGVPPLHQRPGHHLTGPIWLVGAGQSFRVCLKGFDSLYHPSVLWHIKSGCICWDVVVKLGNDAVSKAQMGLGVGVLMNSLSLKAFGSRKPPKPKPLCICVWLSMSCSVIPYQSAGMNLRVGEERSKFHFFPESWSSSISEEGKAGWQKQG